MVLACNKTHRLAKLLWGGSSQVCASCPGAFSCGGHHRGRGAYSARTSSGDDEGAGSKTVEERREKSVSVEEGDESKRWR